MPDPRDRLPTSKTQSDGADALASDVGGDTVSSPNDPDADSGSPTLRPSEHRGEVGRLGRYRVLQRLGVGGMGAVYLAFDEGLRRRAALKVMLPKFAAVPSARERFLREARTCAGVKSEHVVTIYDVGDEGGTPFIAMEYLQGYPLDEYFKRHANQLSVAQVLRVGREVAQGLAAAHAMGLVHRDIKPANLWLEAPKGRVKILDFGLAKGVNPDATEDDGHLTNTGAVVGTPAYMSPEQARGQPVDARTDLFSLGGVLYRLTTGRLPFTGPTTMAILTSLGMDDPPPVRELNPAVPDALADLIHRLLAKKPAQHPASAAEVAAELQRIERALAAGELSSADPVPLATAVSDEPQVIYVPIQVTSYEPSAFAGLDEPSSAIENADRAAPAKPKRERPTRGGRMGWAVVAASVLLAGALGGLLWWKFTTPKPPAEDPKPVAKGTGEKKEAKKDEKKKDEPPVVVPAAPTFFNGTLDGWTSTGTGSGKWAAEGGEIVCRTPAAGTGYNLLTWDGPARDFLFTFEAQAAYHPGKGGESFLRFRRAAGASAVMTLAPDTGRLRDDTADRWKAFPGLSDPPVASRTPAAGGYSAFTVLVVGRRLTATANNVVVADNHELPAAVPPAGTITWQVNAGVSELRLRNLRFVELPAPDPTFFNGKSLDGWTGDEKVWKVENGPVVGAPPAGDTNTHYLVADRPRGDFFLTFRSKYTPLDPKRPEGGGLSCRTEAGGIRSVLVDLATDHIGDLWVNRSQKIASSPASRERVRELKREYDDVAILAVGRRVTVFVDGAVAYDGTLDLPDSGTMHFHLHGNCAELRVRDVVFCDLSKPAVAEADPGRKADRAAAEWVLSKNGDVRLAGDTSSKKTGDTLPPGPFKLTKVRLLDQANPMTDDDLPQFAACVDITHFEFWHARITDKGVKTLAGFSYADRVRYLEPGSPKLSDVSMPDIARFTGLTHLSLKNSQITDDGLVHLYKLTNLKDLDIRYANRLTKNGIDKLTVALPQCKILWSDGVIEPTKK